MNDPKKNIKILVTNRQAPFEYFIDDEFEAGIALKGTEVKSIRQGNMTLKEAWVGIESDGRVVLKQASIAVYSHGNIHNHMPDRPRELLLRNSEIAKMQKHLEVKGGTLVPLRVYAKGQYIKLAIGLGRGKKQYDKRETTKEREAYRDIERALKR